MTDTRTKNAIAHWVRIHHFYQNGERYSRPSEQDSVGNGFILCGQHELRQNLTSKIPQHIFNADVFKHLLIRWIIINNITFNQAVSPVLKFLLMYLWTVVNTQFQN